MKIEIENYQKTYYVYMIKDTITKMVYIGSTSNLLCRIANHISQYKKGCTLCSSSKVLKNDSYTVEVLRSGLNENTVKQSERDFILAYADRCVNINLPSVISQEEYKKEYAKKYRKAKADITKIVIIDTYTNSP